MNVLSGKAKKGEKKIQVRIYYPVKHLLSSFIVKIVNGFQPVTVFAKSSKVDVLQRQIRL